MPDLQILAMRYASWQHFPPPPFEGEGGRGKEFGSLVTLFFLRRKEGGGSLLGVISGRTFRYKFCGSTSPGGQRSRGRRRRFFKWPEEENFSHGYDHQVEQLLETPFSASAHHSILEGRRKKGVEIEWRMELSFLCVWRSEQHDDTQKSFFFQFPLC